eukprot:snap_masked-scaffold_6-processed-gene-11.41-mRNA-1 protein AED:1.00 eAED:1.00 QI:0/0/0/0/1/1/2/0/67
MTISRAATEVANIEHWVKFRRKSWQMPPIFIFFMNAHFDYEQLTLRCKHKLKKITSVFKVTQEVAVV